MKERFLYSSCYAASCKTAHSKCVLSHDSEADSARLLLAQSGLNLLDAARLTLELVEACDGKQQISAYKKIITLGAAQLKKEENTVSFAVAFRFTLESKKDRSSRTLQDIRQTLTTLMRCQADLANKPIRSIDTAYCKQILQKAYRHSPSRFIKARANLSGLFNLGIKEGWCSENPVTALAIPTVREGIINALPLAKIKTLIQTAHQQEHRACLAPLGLMLYAGVRPEEVKRLHWEDIDWDDKMLYLDARHAKTGGGRHIPLAPVLIKMLAKVRNEGFICPPAWTKRWRALREAAGFDAWVPDVLRHSFASYHAKLYQDLPKLQLAMGHRDCQLLLTRYINLRGLSKSDAKQFWKGAI